ncbi:MAG: SGNH/GDSL hydrolase family protein [Clostridiaceae bacterium]|nr:SGNH/GDSL hydrolase family protein [Clostridiaceae bacterium]
MRKKKIISFVILILAVFTLGWLLQKLLMPKYMTKIVEGALISEYYDEKNKDHDVIFIGDCEVYENFSPITLWEKYGITSYIRGSAQQLIWHSYYILEDTLKYEKPDVVVFSVLSMMYDKPQKEAYNRMSIDGLPLSLTKIKMAKASMLPEEDLITYVFPLLRFHSRWNELSEEDFKYWFKKDKIAHNGYLMRVDVKPASSFPKPRKLADYRFGDICYDYLDKIVKLCKDNDIELVLLKAPSLYPHWYDEWDAQIVDYAKKNDLLYINMLDHLEQIGLDFSTDTYDAGLHLNLSGAEKCSVFLGKILKEKFNLADKRQDENLKAIWQEKIDAYYKMKEEQYKELEEYGYLLKFNLKRAEEDNRLQ